MQFFYRFPSLYEHVSSTLAECNTLFKTTLYDMIAEYTRLGEASGVQIAAPCPCVALVDLDWQNQLSKTQSSVVFIDESMKDLASHDFAEFIQDTDNYIGGTKAPFDLLFTAIWKSVDLNDNVWFTA